MSRIKSLSTFTKIVESTKPIRINNILELGFNMISKGPCQEEIKQG